MCESLYCQISFGGQDQLSSSTVSAFLCDLIRASTSVTFSFYESNLNLNGSETQDHSTTYNTVFTKQTPYNFLHYPELHKLNFTNQSNQDLNKQEQTEFDVTIPSFDGKASHVRKINPTLTKTPNKPQFLIFTKKEQCTTEPQNRKNPS